MNPDTAGWHVEMVGLVWWLILPGALIAALAMMRLMGWELSRLPGFARRGLSWLRGATIAIVVLLLLEPTIAFTSIEHLRPAVAVMIDRSGSMDVNDVQMSLSHRLDEAIALSLIDQGIRPDGLRRVRQELLTLLNDLPTITAAVVATQEAWTHGQLPPGREQALRLCSLHQPASTQLASALAGNAATAALFTNQAEALKRATALLKRERSDPQAEKPEQIAAALNALGEHARSQLPKLEAAQEASDQVLLKDAKAAPALRSGLAILRTMSRFDRACRLTTGKLAALLKERAEVTFFAIDDGGLTEISDPKAFNAARPTGTTDFASPFTDLARRWREKPHVGGVVLLSDGRQTAGVDPIAAVRALAAGGARLAGVLVGDEGEIRDAVVAEIQAPAEVFHGETVRLDVRYRITGFPGKDWNIILSKDGTVYEKRTVRGEGRWQTERFELPDAQAGVHNFQARIERADGHRGVAGVGGMQREVWNGIGGYEVRDFTNHPSFAGKPSFSELIRNADVKDDHENYGERLRGYVVPPQDGRYVFFLSADDKAELWLSTGADPAKKVKIADVFDWVEQGVWDKYESQHSQPVALEKGKPYYLEVLHKQAGGSGHVAVGWQLPDQSFERPIPGPRLATLDASTPDGKGVALGDPDADADAEASLANNQADCSVVVNDDPLKVLLVDASPRWESRYLVNLFERDKRVEVVRRYLSVRQARGERELLPATQEELDSFDLVVVGDLAPGEMTAADQGRLERFVVRRGGFAVFIAGTRGMPASYALGGIANLLPVRVVATATGSSAPVPLEMTSAASDNPIVAVLDDAALNRKMWTVLPPLRGIAQGVIAKPGAEVLLETANDLKVPVVAVQRTGAGRVLWVGSPEVWRWRDRIGDRVHQTFWLQAVRWGLGLRLRGKDARLQAALDRALISPNESAELRVRARRSDGSAITQPAKALVGRLDDKGMLVPGSQHDLELSPVRDAEGQWHVTLAGLAEGHWRITVSSSASELGSLTEVRDLVVRSHQNQEGIDLSADRANLERLARAGGFRSDTLDQAVPLITELCEHLDSKDTPHRTTHSLWDNYGALLLVLSLLSVEWMWRKRVGLP
jgi:hypothetical protein